jgi:membrane fusion protein, multidrug efflux system
MSGDSLVKRASIVEADDITDELLNAPETGDKSKAPDPQREQSQTVKTTPAKKGKNYFLWVSVVLFVGLLGGLGWWLYSQGQEETDDAYVDGHITTISSRVAGTVTKVFVDDNQRVSVNQPLVKLDPRDYQVRVNQLKAALQQAQKQSGASKTKIGQSTLSAQGQQKQASGEVSSATASIDSNKAALLSALDAQRKAESRIVEEKAQLEYARSDFERYKLVYEQRAVTKQQYDRAKENIKVAEAQLEGARNDLQQTKSKVLQAEADVKNAEARELRAQGQVTSAQATEQQTDIDTQQYQGQVASIQQSKSNLDEVLLQLSYTNINAPVPGKVGRKSVEVGQRVEVGQALMAIVQDNYWVTANFKETQLNKMKIGQEAEVQIDSFGGKKFLGHVDSFSPASGAKFSVLPPDNATGNFTKVVQRVPVKIVLDPQSVGDFGPRITPGMSCVATVFVKNKK